MQNPYIVVQVYKVGAGAGAEAEAEVEVEVEAEAEAEVVSADSIQRSAGKRFELDILDYRS